jgi:RimJ/RimL family protein N-acetyltransferase
MRLHIPSLKEAKELLATPPQFHGHVVFADALPPAVLLEKAIASDDHFWLMPRLYLDDESGQVVGSGGFKFAPRNRRVEIGYGVSAAFRCRGHSTEGVKLLTDEAFASGLVDGVDADTAQCNHASQRVLEKAGFMNYGSGEDADGPLFLWKKERPNKSSDSTASAGTSAAEQPRVPASAASHL